MISNFKLEDRGETLVESISNIINGIQGLIPQNRSSSCSSNHVPVQRGLVDSFGEPGGG